MSEQFSRNTMLSVVWEALDEGYRTLGAIQTDKTNTDPWIIGRYQATKALEQFDGEDNLIYPNPVESICEGGIFGAIGYVRAYELDEFGSVGTDLSDPEEVAITIAYVNMEYVLNDLSNVLGTGWDDELTDDQVDRVKTYVDQQVK